MERPFVLVAQLLCLELVQLELLVLPLLPQGLDCILLLLMDSRLAQAVIRAMAGRPLGLPKLLLVLA